MAIASASDKVTGTDCWASMRAGQATSPTVISTCLMFFPSGERRVVRSSPPTRKGHLGFRPRTRAGSPGENLAKANCPACGGSIRRSALRHDVPRGELDLHEPPFAVEPKMGRTRRASGDRDVAQRGGSAIQGRGLHAEVLDGQYLAARAAGEDGGQGARSWSGQPGGEHVQREDGVIEHNRVGGGGD